MSNNSGDITGLFKSITLNEIFDINQKVIKTTRACKTTIRVNGTTTTAANNFIATNNNATINLNTVAFTPTDWFNDRWYFRATTVTARIRVYYIDGDYNEGTVDLLCTVNDNIQIPFPVRFVNGFEKISGTGSGSVLCTYEPTAIFPSGLSFTIHQYSGFRGYSGMFMCPKNKTAKLNSIDYYRNNARSDLLLLKYNKYNAGTNLKPNVLLYLPGITGVYSQNFNNPNYLIQEGEVIVFYNVTTFSTSSAIDSTFEINTL
jgi:hypothetical protein